jgi:hypothetical protein
MWRQSVERNTGPVQPLGVVNQRIRDQSLDGIGTEAVVTRSRENRRQRQIE